MRTRETVLAALALLLVAAPAAAQESDPTLNESDFDTDAPPSNESYLEAEGNATAPASEEPTLDESDFDTSAPPADESYLDAEGGDGAGASAGADAGDAPVPGLGLVAALAATCLAAYAIRRRA